MKNTLQECYNELQDIASKYSTVDTLKIGLVAENLKDAMEKEHRLLRNCARWIHCHDIYGHMAKELLNECKEVLNDDGEFLFK